MTETFLREAVLALPVGNDKDRRGNLPAVLSNFHCNGAIEGAEACDNLNQMHQCYSKEGGKCAKVKHDVTKECANSGYQTSWNDGFKMHTLGFHLIEMDDWQH